MFKSLIRPMPAPQLPCELLDAIVRALPTVTSRKPCTLVSRSWAEAAYPLVFRCIKLSEHMLMDDPPTRGRYCVRRLMDCLLTCSAFLPFCVKELYLDTFDSDGFTFSQFKQVLSRFPGIDVIGYDVRHFVLSPPSPSDPDQELLPPSLPIAPGRHFSRIHISIGEYGTASAFSQFISLFDSDCIEELSFGHLELEEDRCSCIETDYRRARPRTLVKQTTGGLTKENMRILLTILDNNAVRTVHDETDGAHFISFLSKHGLIGNIIHLSCRFPARYHHFGSLSDQFGLSKFSNLRALSVSMEMFISSEEGIAVWEPFDTVIGILNFVQSPSTLDVDVEFRMINAYSTEETHSAKHPTPAEQYRARAASLLTYFNVNIVQDMGRLKWGALGRAIHRLLKSGCQPAVRIRVIVQDIDDPNRPGARTRLLSGHNPSTQLGPLPRAEIERVNTTVRNTVLPRLIQDARVRERLSFEAVFDLNVE